MIKIVIKFMRIKLDICKFCVSWKKKIFLNISVEELAKAGITILVGPPNVEISNILDALSVDYGITFLSYFWESNPCGYHRNGYNLFPTQQYYKALFRVLDYWQWERTVIVIEKSNSSLSNFIKFH